MASIHLRTKLLPSRSSGLHKIKLNTQIIFILIFIKFLWPSIVLPLLKLLFFLRLVLSAHNYDKQIKKKQQKKRNNNGNVTGKNARVGGCDKIYDSRWVELNRPKKRNFAEIKRFV